MSVAYFSWDTDCLSASSKLLPKNPASGRSMKFAWQSSLICPSVHTLFSDDSLSPSTAEPTSSTLLHSAKHAVAVPASFMMFNRAFCAARSKKMFCGISSVLRIVHSCGRSSRFEYCSSAKRQGTCSRSYEERMHHCSYALVTTDLGIKFHTAEIKLTPSSTKTKSVSLKSFSRSVRTWLFKK